MMILSHIFMILYYNKSEIVNKLNEIADWADEVIDSKGSKIILHLGI